MPRMTAGATRWPSRPVAAYLRSLHLILPCAVLVALWLPGIGQGWPRTDSHRYAAVALDLYSHGDPLSMSVGDAPYFNKPPAAFVIHGLPLHALRAAGLDIADHVWAMRAPALVAALIAAAALAHTTRRLHGRPAALLAGLALATTLEFFRYTRAISLDLWLAAFSMLGVALLVEASGRGAAPRARWALAIAAGTAFGCGLLAKPFVAFLPMLIALGFFVARLRAAGLGERSAAPAAACAVTAIAVSGAWYGGMIAVHGEAFVAVHFGRETLGRGSSEALSGNPWWEYAEVLAGTWWPWLALFAGSAALAALGRFPTRDRAGLWLAFLWGAGWIVALTLFPDRRSRYLAPAFPLLCVPAALVLVRCVPAPSKRGGRLVMPFVPPAALAAGVVLLALPIRVHPPRDPGWDRLVSAIEAAQARDAGVTVWTTPEANTDAANLYLLTGVYPRLVGPEAGPAPGDLVFRPRRADDAALPVLAEHPPYVLATTTATESER